MFKEINKLKLSGRYSIKDGNYIFYNGGSSLSFKMKGSGFSLGINFKPIEGYIYIIIDKDYTNKVKFLVKNPIFSYEFKDNKVHYVDIIKANEANDNAMEISSLDINGELLDYDFSHKLNVKVYGDSTIAGYGILAKSGDANIHTNDSVRDFCFHALYELNANIDIVSASGWGLVFSDYTDPKEMGIINFKDKLSVWSKEDYKENNKTDLLIISLGTNDYSYIKLEDSVNRIKRFINSYKELIDSEINKNKDLKILMVYGTLKEEEVYPLIVATYEYLKPFYKNLFIHKFDGDNSGISNHAYVDKHEEMAKELKQVILDIIQK